MIRSTRQLLLLAVASVASFSVWADEPDGVYAWQDGKGTCYQLSSGTQFSYDNSGNVVVTVGGTEKRTLDISTKDAKVNYGTYAAMPEVTLNSNGVSMPITCTSMWTVMSILRTPQNAGWDSRFARSRIRHLTTVESLHARHSRSEPLSALA